uniref:Xylulose kinase-like n=1 Tax=Callorhinchus milii TaxID=7868 RepID=A0A4W3J0M2_CALMI
GLNGYFTSDPIAAFSSGKESKVLATGGASVNLDILQVLSDVFNSPVYTIKTSDSACLGSAFRAKQGPTGKAFRDVIKTGPEPKLVVRPSPESEKAYCVSRFQMLEHSIMHSCDMPE